MGVISRHKGYARPSLTIGVKLARFTVVLLNIKQIINVNEYALKYMNNMVHLD